MSRSQPGTVARMGRHDPLPSDALAGIHVLIIDDDPEARDLIRTVLRYCGALVSVATGAGEGLDTLQRVLPDVIATGNIGCMVQLADGVAPVVHTVELLDWATGGPAPRALASSRETAQGGVAAAL